ncbi:MAG: hypothetical protein JXR13_01625 [Thalassovita sp.]
MSEILDKLFFAFDTTKTLRGGVSDLERLLEPANLTRISERQRAISELMAQIDANSSDAKSFVQDLRDNSRSMSSTLKDLSKIIQSSNIVSLNARIIAQGHRHRALGAQLVRLAESISDISGDATDLVSEMFEVIDSIVTATDEMGHNVEERASALLSSLKPKAQSLDRALTSLETGMKAAHSASTWLAEFVTGAERDVSEVISALQVGDRSRQRAEHVRKVADFANRYSPMSMEARALMTLARAQMQQTVTEAVTDTRKASQLLADLANRQDEFLSQCRKIAISFEEGAANLSAASQTSTETGFDFEASAQSEAEAQGRLKESDDALATRSKTLSDHAFQMQLASLNTIITCARGFKQAMDMIMISQQINEVISEAPGTFEQFSDTMEQTKQRVAEWARRDAGNITQEIEGMGEDDPTLTEARTVLQKLLPSLNTDAPKIARSITSAAASFFAFFQELEDLAKTDPVTIEPLPLSDLEPSEMFIQHLDELYQCYTMQAERDIQDVMFSQLPGLAEAKEEAAGHVETVAAAPAEEAAADDDLSDIFF